MDLKTFTWSLAAEKDHRLDVTYEQAWLTDTLRLELDGEEILRSKTADLRGKHQFSINQRTLEFRWVTSWSGRSAFALFEGEELVLSHGNPNLVDRLKHLD